MRAKEKGREMWGFGLAVVLSACLVLGVCSSAHAFPHGVVAKDDHTVGLKSDGTVAGAGYNGFGQLKVGSWSNIGQLAAGDVHTVGLKSDGTVVAVGYNNYGQLNVATWKLGQTNKKNDFNGDGKTDTLWRNASNGMNAVWFMNETTVTGFAVFDSMTDQSWEIVGR
jgi:hypothetical protein